MKRLIVTLAAVALLAGGVAVISVTTASPSTALQVDDAPDRPADEKPRFRHGRPGHALETAAGAIGIETADLAAAIGEGASIAEVAAQHGVAAEDVVNALVEEANTRIDQAAADERISAERAAALKASVAEKVTDMVNGELERRPGRRGPHRGQGPGGKAIGRGLDAAAEVIGVTVEDLHAALRDGSTLAEVAAANGVTTEALVTALVAEAIHAIDQAVANQKIDGERAADLKAGLTDRVTDLVSTEHGACRGHGPRQGFGRGAPGFGGPPGATDTATA